MIFEKIKAIICEQFGVEDDVVTLGMSFEELDADELDMVDIAMSIEDEFNTEITDEVLEQFRTISDIVNYLEEI